jgi:3'-5' exonuclease
MKTIVFDIETGPLTDAELAAMVPPFDPAEVKTGNLKDPGKVLAKVAEAEANHRREFIERAALDPLTGRVVAIGLWYLAGDKFEIIGHDDEAQMLRELWAACRGEMGRVHEMVGFNTHQFDLPFLIRRSWKHRVEVPFGIRRGRYWSDEMVDLRECWQLGDRQARGSLDSIAKHLGVGGKNGDGKVFAELWQTDREKAVSYLRNDLELTAKIANVLGITKDFGPCRRRVTEHP